MDQPPITQHDDHAATRKCGPTPVDVTFFLSNEYQRKALTCWSATLSPAGCLR
ncbi:hypothetical protein ABIE35_003946 [Paenarthrobacter sp. 4246]